MRVEIHEVVHLHELDALVLEQRHRALHLLDALLFAVAAGSRRPHLRGHEHLGLLLGRQQVAEHRFRGRIHRRGVDERGAGREECLQHFAQRCARRSRRRRLRTGPRCRGRSPGCVSPVDGMRRMSICPAGAALPPAALTHARLATAWWLPATAASPPSARNFLSVHRRPPRQMSAASVPTTASLPCATICSSASVCGSTCVA